MPVSLALEIDELAAALAVVRAERHPADPIVAVAETGPSRQAPPDSALKAPPPESPLQAPQSSLPVAIAAAPSPPTQTHHYSVRDLFSR
jgi:hypothetical protein